MTTDAQGNRHDRAGRFAGHVNSAPSSELDQPASAPDEALQALEAVGLTVDDLPGFTEAWDAAFGPLAGPWPAPPVRVVEEITDQPAGTFDHVYCKPVDGVFVVAVRYRQDDDDDDPRTDTLLISEPNEVTRLQDAIDGEEVTRELNARARSRDAILSGESPAWHVFVSREARETAAVERTRHANTLAGLVRAGSDRDAEVSTTLTLLLANDRLDVPPELAEQHHRTELALLDADGKVARYFADRALRPIRVRDAIATIQAYRQAASRSTRAAAMKAEAELLPEGPLREFLLDTRPEQSYPVVEGKGRNKRTVQRTYTPRSELQTEVDEAQKSLDRARAERDELAGRIATFAAQNAPRVRVLDDARIQAQAASRAHWALGWPGDPADIPARPTVTMEVGF